MTADNKQLMSHLFTEIAKDNFEPFLGLIADDMCWTVIGTTTWSVMLTGR